MESLLVEMDNAHKYDISKFMTRTHHLSYDQNTSKMNQLMLHRPFAIRWMSIPVPPFNNMV